MKKLTIKEVEELTNSVHEECAPENLPFPEEEQWQQITIDDILDEASKENTVKNKVYTEAEVLSIIARISSKVWEECGKTIKVQNLLDSKHTINMTAQIGEYLTEMHFNIIEGWHPEFNHPQEIEELYI